MIDYTAILIRRYPGSDWTLNGDNYDGLTWNSKSNKPTKNELDVLWDEVKKEIEQEKKNRQLQKQEILDRLGITEDEAKIIFS